RGRRSRRDGRARSRRTAPAGPRGSRAAAAGPPPSRGSSPGSGGVRPRLHGWSSCSGGVLLRRQGGDQRVVLRDEPELGGAAGRAEVVEELDVRLVVVLPLVGDVVLVVDRLDRADRLARPAVDALGRVDVQRPLTLVDAVDGTLL